METVTLDHWNETIANLPGRHLLQTREWAAIKADNNWEVLPQVWRDPEGRVKAAALVLIRTIRVPVLPVRFSILYIPRGPMLDWADARLRSEVFEDVQALAEQRKAIFVKIDPEVVVGTGVPETEDAMDSDVGDVVLQDLRARGWQFSDEQIQFRNTVWIDLEPAEDELLARMKQKTRYNIRLAGRKGVEVRTGTGNDLSTLYQMYAETSVRDGFVIRPESYYVQVWHSFMQAGMATPLIAEVEDDPVAGLVLFHFAGRSWYLHGMSREVHRNKMPTYLLQWEAMRLAKAQNCHVYDLWGAPDVFHEEDSMWGVFRFKQGLGGKVIRTVGAWDYPVRPLYYALYTRILPRLLDVMRRRGKSRTRQEIED